MKQHITIWYSPELDATSLLASNMYAAEFGYDDLVNMPACDPMADYLWCRIGEL